MYSHLSPKSQVLIRISLASAWTFSTLGGLSAVVFLTPTNDPGLLLEARAVAGVTLTVSALIATFGVLFNRYRFEWVASWFATAGFAPYIILYWSIVYKNIDGTLPVAFIMMSLVSFYIHRGFLCGAHAERLRHIHTDTDSIVVVYPQEEADG